MKFLYRKKQQSVQFFKEIIRQLGPVHELLIIGPAEMKFEFKKYIEGDNTFSPGTINVETIDSITDNQIKAYIRDWYSDE